MNKWKMLCTVGIVIQKRKKNDRILSSHSYAKENSILTEMEKNYQPTSRNGSGSALLSHDIMQS